MNILSREKGQTQKKLEDGTCQATQQEDPECVDTKLYVWENDQFEQLQVDYLNQVFPEKINKETMIPGTQFIFHFLSNSLDYWVELKDPQISQDIQSTTDITTPRLSTKDTKYLEQVLNEQGCDNCQNYNRWAQQFNKSQKFHQNMQKQNDFQIPKGQKIHQYYRHKINECIQQNGESIKTQVQEKFQIYKYKGSNSELIEYKKKFQILFLLYIDGVSFVNQETNEWEYYIIFKVSSKNNKNTYTFIGVLSKFIFKITTQRIRQRISQVFIMPSYQKHGHGGQLIDYVYRESIKNPFCFELTTQVPSFEYQCLRDYRECLMLLQGAPGSQNIQSLLNYKDIPYAQNKFEIQNSQEYLLNKEKIRDIKLNLKIPGNQIERLVNLFLYAKILEGDGQENNDMHQAIFEQHTRDRIIYNRSAFKSRKKIPHITFYGNIADMKEFFLQKSKQDMLRDQDEIQDILSQTLDGFRRVITKLRKNKHLSE